MEVVKSVKIDSAESNYTQYLQYEVNSYKTILNDVLINKNPEYTYSVENYKHFMEEFKNANIKLHLYVDKLLEKYTPEYRNNKEYEYFIDGSDHTLNIYKANQCSCSSKGGCQC